MTAQQTTEEQLMFVVEEESKLDDSLTSGVIVIEHRNPDPIVAYSEARGLRGPGCRRLALQYAAKLGLASPGVNGNVDTYPVDANGNEVKDPRATNKFKAFRASVPVTRKLF